MAWRNMAFLSLFVLGVSLGTPALAAAGETFSYAAFLQSFVILLREGAEAVLIFAAIWVVLTSMAAGAAAFHALVWGAIIGIAASVLAAFAVVWGLGANPAAAELLEGISLLLAAIVLLFVSSWLLGKREAQAWQKHVTDTTRQALSQGRLFGIFAIGFLAIFREGAETVLFYQALIASEGFDLAALMGGAVLAVTLLAVAFLLVKTLGIRLPMRAFFTVTAWALFALAVLYGGKGVHELQEAGMISETVLAGLPKISALGIYPTLETLATQLFLLAAGGLFNWRALARPSEPQEAQIKQP